MEIRKSTLRKIQQTAAGVFIVLAVILIVGVILSGNNTDNTATANNVIQSTDGTQIVKITARGGYTPKFSEAKADTPTILRISTKNTFDCSALLTIPKLGITRNLPPNGDTDIAIDPQKAGTLLDVSCAMGMYYFQVKFV